MRGAILAGLFVLASFTVSHAQEESGAIKSWLALDWSAKTEFMTKNGADFQQDCEVEEWSGISGCWMISSLEISGWTVSMMASETEPFVSKYCVEKTGGRLRRCKDDDTGEITKFFRNGDEWSVFGQ